MESAGSNVFNNISDFSTVSNVKNFLNILISGEVVIVGVVSTLIIIDFVVDRNDLWDELLGYNLLGDLRNKLRNKLLSLLSLLSRVEGVGDNRWDNSGRVKCVADDLWCSWVESISKSVICKFDSVIYKLINCESVIDIEIEIAIECSIELVVGVEVEDQ